MRTVVFRGEVIPVGDNLPRRQYARIVYVCGTCGESWGKLETTTPYPGGYYASMSPCPEHNTYHQSHGGSFLRQLRDELDPKDRSLAKTLELLSPRLLRHEAEMKAKDILRKAQK